MLFKTNLDVKCILNFYIHHGINEKGELKLDRYNLKINANSKDSDINALITALETYTGLEITHDETNRDKQKNVNNTVRAILTLRDGTLTNPPVTMPLRYKPDNHSEDNISAVKKAFTHLVGMVD